MRRKTEQKPDVFESEWFVFALLGIGLIIGILEGMAIWKGIDGQFFGVAVAGLGALGGYLLKGFQGRK